MQRSRTTPPTASSEDGVASLPQGLPSLDELLQQARAPGAARAEVDALIAGLAQPLGAEQSPRERADLLLALIEDKHLGDFTGSKGHTVRAAAVQALLALGYPYALEVPPEALETRPTRRDAARPPKEGLLSSGKGWAGLSLIVLLGLGQLIPALYIADMFSDSTKATVLATAIVSATTFFPGLLVMLGHLKSSPLLRGMGSVLLVLVGLVWLMPGLFVLMNSAAGLIPMAVGVLYFIAVGLMESTAPDPD